MENKVLKRELIVAKYDKLKRKIWDWEQAVFKTEGRNPNREDMKQAPKEVQESYKNLVKLKKYLAESQGCTEKSVLALTPGKLFLGGRKKELKRLDHSFQTVSSSPRMFRLSKEFIKTKKPTVAAEASLGLRSPINRFSEAAKVKPDQDSSNTSSQAPFKKLFKSLASADTNKKPDRVKESEGVLGNTDSLPDELNTINISSDVINLADNSRPDEIDNETTTKEILPSCSLKSPRFKGRQSIRPAKNLDPGWLARLNNEDDNENCENEVSLKADEDMFKKDSNELLNTSDNNQPDCTATTSNSNPMNSSNESLSLSEGNASMEVDPEVNDKPTNAIGINFCNDNSDSGICINSSSIFNSEELKQAMQEVLTETAGDRVSAADGSLLYSFSEDACLPSDTEDFTADVDSNHISNLIQCLSETINEEEEDGNNSMNSHCSGDGQNFELPNVRKRSAAYAFSPSPSPEKDNAKRKFFKGSRGDRKKLYSRDSYKPPSPKKRITRGSKSLGKNPMPKLVLRKIDDENSNSSEWTSNFVSNEDIKSPDLNVTKPVNPKKPTVVVPKVKKVTAKGRKTGRPRKKANYEEADDETKTKDVGDDKKRSNVVIDDFDEGQMPKPSGGKRQRGKYGRNRKPETLESKMKNGKLEDNFVRIDLKKKVFVRGHKKINAAKVKRLDWKLRKSMQGKEKAISDSTFKTLSCNKCGEKGHFAKYCLKDTMMEEVPGEVDESPLPTLEEAARMVYKGSNSQFNLTRVSIYKPKVAAATTTEAGDAENVEAIPCPAQPSSVTVSQLMETLDPFFGNEESDILNEEEVILEGLKLFGYDSFRPGQKEAIARVLKGLSTLLILSTGSGKSLCYQLPAYLYGKKYPGALTLCVSPLVSLMEDQVQGIPSFLNAGCLHSGMTDKQKSIVLDKVKKKQLHILLVSPEAVCGGLFGLLKGSADSLPKISFACIDEVHCVSQWSHNFRPSYLQICKILREKLNVHTILGLTATATKTTARSICEHLNIDPSTAIRGELIPLNLKLSVSRDVYKDEALINLLRGERFQSCDSIIIYCTRREECERIATLLRTKLQEISMNKIIRTKSGARLSGNCEAYHAGMTSRRRKNVQNGFMSGDIRIVVATVAFGMGIDKSDIRAVIHYNMPSAFESYVQEIGRAGRDGLPAHCHLFLDNAKRSDLNELKRHVYANSVDRPTIRKLLRKVFGTCKCKQIEKLRGREESSKAEDEDSDTSVSCQGHEVSFGVEKCVMDLDLPKENIMTLLCYLELDEKKWIETLPFTYETCKIQSYAGAKCLKAATSRCPPFAVAMALLKENNKYREANSFVEFNVIEAAATVGWNSSVVKSELKQLEWAPTQFDERGNPTRHKKSGLLVEFTDLAFRVKSRGSLSDEEADEVLNTLHGRNVQQEQTQIYQLHRVYEALLSVSFPNINNLCDTYDEDRSDQLKSFIYEYFSEEKQNNSELLSNAPDISSESDKVENLRRSIRNLIASNRDVQFTARSVARILQGISSPCFPSDMWYRNREFWRKYMDLDFHFICRIASEEL